jgi:hypothetical protein
MTILFFHIISARPSKQPRMVGSTLGIYSFGLFLFLQEQIKDIIIIRDQTIASISLAPPTHPLILDQISYPITRRGRRVTLLRCRHRRCRRPSHESPGGILSRG